MIRLIGEFQLEDIDETEYPILDSPEMTPHLSQTLLFTTRLAHVDGGKEQHTFIISCMCILILAVSLNQLSCVTI